MLFSTAGTFLAYDYYQSCKRAFGQRDILSTMNLEHENKQIFAISVLPIIIDN
jgi:hypothetical protein